MDSYLQPQDDGLALRRSGQWVAEKLDYLRRYINIFSTSMRGKPRREINYIDLFSGPGKCLINRTSTVLFGSPLLAVTAQHPFTNYFFVDFDENSIDALKQRCGTSDSGRQIQYFVGDSNTIVKEVVDQILETDSIRIPGLWSSLNLAFLDPEGLELHWDTVAALAKAQRMDLIIHYPQGGLNRYMSKACEANEQNTVDQFFGGTEWRGIFEEHGNNHRLLIDHYRQKLKNVGYQEVLRDDEVGDEPLMRNARRRAPLYRLLFASKHALGHTFWHAVTRRDVYGQQRLF